MNKKVRTNKKTGKKGGFLPEKTFVEIYSQVPRLNVDLLVRKDKEVLLALRSIEPYMGHWHMPGGTIYKNESVNEAAQRIAKTETGLDVSIVGCLGYLEFPNETRFDTPMHTISIVVEVSPKKGKARQDKNSSELKWHSEIPENTVFEHSMLLNGLGILA